MAAGATTGSHPWLYAARPLALGVVHLQPLPGSPRSAGGGMAPVLSAAFRDAERILEAGFDGFIIENFGDAPFFKEEVPIYTTTAMCRIATELRARFHGASTRLGVNVLRNDAAAALAIAAAVELSFIRVNVHVGAALTDQGVVEGRAAETLRLRATLGAEVAIMADVEVKHARPLAPGYQRGAAAKETLGRGGADGLIVSGSATGQPVDDLALEEIAQAALGAPIWIGSGATASSAPHLLQTATGLIVGTAIKEGGDVLAPVDLSRARAFIEAIR